MATIGKLVVSLSANSAKLVSELSKTKKSVSKWGADIAKTVAKVGAVFAALGVAAFGGLIVAVNKSAAEVDKLAKSARKLGIDVGELQKMHFIFEQTGISIETGNMALQRMVRRVSEAAQGTGEAVNALKELGINAQELARLSPENQFNRISEAMRGIGNQGDKVRLAMKLFDSEGVALVNTMAADIQGLGAEFESLGIKLTATQASMVEKYQDSKNVLSTMFDGFAKQVTAELSPAFTLIVEKITNSIKSMGGMKSAAEKFAKFIIRGMVLATEAIGGAITAVQELLLTLKKAQLMYMIMDNLAGKLVPFGEDYSPAQMQKVANDILSMEKRIAEGSGVKQSVIDFMNSLQDAVESNSVSKINDMKLPDGSRDFNGIVAAMDAANEAADAHKKLAVSANETAEMLNKVTTSKAWQDIFGKADITARANQFDTYAKLAKSNIESGSAFAGDNINTLKSILETATNNGGTGFSNNNLFEKLDLTGMADVIRGLESMASSNQQAVTAQQKPTSKISIDLTSDTGRVAGEIWGEAEFIRGIEEWNKQYMNDRARATAQ
jgi:hypothetical protein